MVARNQNGFTLVEVLVSMAIFAFGILAVINMQLLSSWTNTKSRYMTEGVVVAQGKIEELMGQPYSSILDDNGNGNSDQTVFLDASLDDAGEGVADYSDPGNASTFYNLYWNVREDYPFDGTKTVRVIVRWDEKGLAKTFSLDMLKSDGD